MFLAGIVLYNPEIDIVKQNIKTLSQQGFEVLLVDNCSKNKDEIISLEGAKCILNDDNLGVGRALNQICEYSKEHGFHWSLLLDQDSIVPDNLLDEYKKRIEYDKLAILCPTIIEDNINQDISSKTSDTEIQVRKCITSGSMVSTDIWSKVGKFDEDMFIDYVDFDYCYKVGKQGYVIIQLPSVKLLHSLGDSKLRRCFWWKIRVSGHSEMRKYYISRNIVIFMRRYMGFRVFVLESLRLLKLFLLVVIYEDGKRQKLSAIKKGIGDGLKWKQV